jgi:hypothetical protein
VLSQDGLPLAAYPEAEEAAIAALWSRLASVGPVTRGFLTVRSEVWAFVQGERHGAMVVADRAVRPGQMLDVLDGVLAQAAAAEVLAGSDRLGVGRGDPRAPAARRFSTPLHRDGRPAEHDDEAVPVAADVVVSLDEAAASIAVARATTVDASVEPSGPAAGDGVADGAVYDGGADVDSARTAEPSGVAQPASGIAPAPPAAVVAAPAQAQAAPVPVAPTIPTIPVTEQAAESSVAAAAPAQAVEAAAPVESSAAPVESSHAAGPEGVGAEPPAPEAAPEPSPSQAAAEGRAGGEVDIIALAREFAGLIIERE